MINIENLEKRLPITEETIHVDVMNHTTHIYMVDDAIFTTSDHNSITDDEYDTLRTDGVVTHLVRNSCVTYYNVGIMNEEVYDSLLNICNIPVEQYDAIQTILHRNSDDSICVTLHNAIDDDIDDKYFTFPSLSIITSLISDDTFRPKHDRIVTFLNTLLDDNIKETLKWS